MATDTLIDIVKVMLPLSLATFGGGASLIAGLEMVAVRQLHWITPADFVHLFAVSRATPGPGVTVGTLIGWQIGGLAGASVASATIFLPTSFLAWVVFRLTNSHRDRKWHAIMRRALAPIGTGLVVAAIWSLFRAADVGATGLLIAVAAFCVVQFAPRVPALAVLFGGATMMVGLEALK